MDKKIPKNVPVAVLLYLGSLPASLFTVLNLQAWGLPERPWWMLILAGLGSMATMLFILFGFRFLKGDK